MSQSIISPLMQERSPRRAGLGALAETDFPFSQFSFLLPPAISIAPAGRQRGHARRVRSPE